MARSENLPAKRAGHGTERIAHLKAKGVLPWKPKDKRLVTEVRDLPHWVKMSLLKVVAFAYTYKQAAAEQGRSLRTLQKWVYSPAAESWVNHVREQIDDPLQLARAIARTDAPGLLIEAQLHYRAARAAGDRAEAGKMLRALMNVSGLEADRAAPTPAAVVIVNMPNSQHIEYGDSSYEQIIEAEVAFSED